MITATVFKLLAKRLDTYFEKYPTHFLIASVVVLVLIYKLEGVSIMNWVIPKDLMNRLSVDWELFLLELGGYFDPIGWSVSINVDDEEPNLSKDPDLTKEERLNRERKRELIHRGEKAWLLDLWRNILEYTNQYAPLLGILGMFYFAVDFLAMYIEFVRGSGVPETLGAGARQLLFYRDSKDATLMDNTVFAMAGISLLGFIVLGVLVRIPYLASIVLAICAAAIFLIVGYGTLTLLDSINGAASLRQKVQKGATALVREATRLVRPKDWLQLLIIIISSVVVYYLLPSRKDINGHSSSPTLVKGPIYLDKAVVVGKDKELYGAENKPAYWFSLSFQLWINPQPPSTGASYSSDATILNMDGRPAVTYNNKSGNLIVSCLNAGRVKEVIYSTKELPLQTWNDIVINFSGGTMEVYLNGELGGSVPGIAPYMTRPLITVGQTDGIAGGIKNLSFRRDTVTPFSARLSSLLNNNFL
jgi:hypothetical protein